MASPSSEFKKDHRICVSSLAAEEQKNRLTSRTLLHNWLVKLSPKTALSNSLKEMELIKKASELQNVYLIQEGLAFVETTKTPKTMKNKGFHLPKTWFLGTKNKVFDGCGCPRYILKADISKSAFSFLRPMIQV